MIHLVLGGVRSGKSAYAETWIAAQSEQVVYLATSEIWDEGMAERVTKHQAQRPDHWCLIEEPIQLANKLDTLNARDKVPAVILECCSLWITNLLCQEEPQDIAEHTKALLSAVSAYQGSIVLVSAEVGLGIMPTNQLARRYGDEIGLLNQKIAAVADKVTLVAAGLPLSLKG